jgi:hypothetical protein
VAENLVELAERFLRLSGELDATRDAMKRLLLNGAGDKPETPFSQPVRASGGQHPKAIDLLTYFLSMAKAEGDLFVRGNAQADSSDNDIPSD